MARADGLSARRFIIATTGSTGSLAIWTVRARTASFLSFNTSPLETRFFSDEELTVAALEPYRALVLSNKGHGMEWAWQFGLYPLVNKRTRFVNRGTERVPDSVLGWFAMRVMEPAAFIMTRRFMLGVKERAEAFREQTSARADDTGNNRTAA